MDQASCPRCGQPTVLAGHLIEGGHSTGPPRFLPEQVQMRLFTGQWWGVEVAGKFRSCLACGLVWSELDANRLVAFVQEHGSELDRDQLAEWDGGPMRGLPDTEAARAVVARVAEIDHHVRSAQPGEATRRYREWTGVTWDEAVAIVKRWRDLSRAEKLARFGWLAKKARPDDLAEPLA